MMYNLTWDAQNWAKIEETVFQIQKQIFNATLAKDIATVRNLQLYLMNTYESRLLAIRRVTTNKGKLTPGIDMWLALNEEDKFKMASGLILDGTSDLVKRVYVPKPGTEDKRPLGIPTIRDRAKQSLCKLVLEPEIEALSDGNSFGFRPGRSAKDAISKIRAHLIFKGPCYVLDTDIRKCFDKIDHNKLRAKLNAMPVIDMQINAWLKAGIFDQGEVIFPTEGTPQGSIISPLLANVALNGLQEHIATNMKKLFDFNQAKNVYFIRYADDFVVLAPTRETIQFAKVLCIQYLAFYGLEMKEEATRIIYTLLRSGKNTIKSEYFDFLGFRFKQRYLSKHTLYFEAGKTTQTRTLVLVNPKRIERHKASISALMKKIGTTKELISQLNPRIIGWCNYFQTSDAKFYGDLPRKMDLWLNAKIRKWIRRTAKLRGKTEKYWKKESKDWILYYQDKNGIETTLVKYNSFRWSIYDYRAIPADFTPYKLNYKDIRTLSLL